MSAGLGQVMVGVPLSTVIDRAEVAVPATLSVTMNVTLTGPPAVVGVPLISPVEALRVSPSGRVPESMDQV